jgi:hypothetical protein
VQKEHINPFVTTILLGCTFSAFIYAHFGSNNFIGGFQKRKPQKMQRIKRFFQRGTDVVWTRGMLLPIPKLVFLMMITANCFIGSAVFVGWPSVLKVYKAEGIYYNLCPLNLTASNITDFTMNMTSPNTGNLPFGTCKEQDDRFNIVYTVASACSFFGSLFFGFVLDFFGPKVASIVANSTVFIGSVFLIFYQCIIHWFHLIS